MIGLDAASAGARVGYDDTSHFNREYKRMLGAPPIRDIERLRVISGDVLTEELSMKLRFP